MCKALLPTILIVLLLTPQQGLSNSLENETVPLNWKSLKAICERIQVPFGAMILLLHHENGHIGLASPNNNGTFDFGPFQVNSVHLKSAEFRAAHITGHGLQFNGQVNSLAAAYLFKKPSSDLSMNFGARPGGTLMFC